MGNRPPQTEKKVDVMLLAIIAVIVFGLMYSYWSNTLSLSKPTTGMRVFLYITCPAVLGEIIGDELHRHYLSENVTLFLYATAGVMALMLELYGGGLNTPAKYHRDGTTGHFEGYYFEVDRYRFIGTDAFMSSTSWTSYKTLKAEIRTLLIIRVCLTMICVYAALDMIFILAHGKYLS